MSMFANNALLGGAWGYGQGLDQKTKKDQNKIKGITKPLMANLDITQYFSCTYGIHSASTSQHVSSAFNVMEHLLDLFLCVAVYEHPFSQEVMKYSIATGMCMM